jgi:hypothetical protein
MKNKFRILVTALIFGLIIGISSFSFASSAPNPPGGGHGNSGNSAGGGGFLPIGSGLMIMLGMGAAYGAKKVYKAFKKDDEKTVKLFISDR